MTSIPEEASRRGTRPSPTSGRGLVLIRPDAIAPRVDGAGSSSPRSDGYFSPVACKRRRDVLASLGCVIFCSGVLGAIPALRPVLGLTAFAGLVGAVYVVMLIRLGGRATERAAKLRYLPELVEDEPTIVIRRAAR
jgi:hypothetical protein